MTTEKRVYILLFVIFFITLPLFSDDNTKSKTDTKVKTEITVDSDHIPEEYGEDEFPVILKDLRRFEIIAIGSFPFTFLISNFAYGFGRYYNMDFDPSYTPSFFMGNGTTVPYTDKEKMDVIYLSLGLSAGMALVDFIIGKLKHEKRTYRPRR